MSLIRGFPNVKSLTRKLNGDGKLRERTVMGREGVQAGYNVRSSFRMPFVAKEKGEANGGGMTTNPSNEIFLSDLMPGWVQASS